MRRRIWAPLFLASAALLVASSSCSTASLGSDLDDDGSSGSDKTGNSDVDGSSATNADGGGPNATGCAPASTRAYDLDGNGSLDSNLALAACATNANETCLVVTSDLAGLNDKIVPLALGHAPDPQTRFAALGSLAGGALSEVSVYTGSKSRAQLLVVDIEAGTLLAKSNVWNGGYDAQFVTELKRDNVLVPVATGQFSDSALLWGKMCIFTPGPDQSPCGNGFVVWNNSPNWVRNDVTYATRNNFGGGWAQDVNGDGHEDLATPFYDIQLNNQMAYYGGFVAISSKTSQTFGMSALRFANRNPTYSSLPANFDSGRFYGIHYGYPPENGTTSLLAVGGLPVGSFKGDASTIMCNVTRYVARIDAPLGNLSASSFRWGYYFGFYQAVFGGSPPAYVIKEPDMLNGCLHRYADSRAVSAEGQGLIAYSLFASDQPADNCKNEQMGFMNSGNATPYHECLSKNFATTGAWQVELLDEASGTKLATASNYLWGILQNLLPNQKGSALLIEPIEGKPRFDQTNLVPKPLGVFAASNAGGWHTEPLGTFPVAGHPKLAAKTPARNIGVVAQSYVEVVTRPNCAAAGLVDIEMEAGGWVGFDPAKNALVAKP